MRQLFLPSGARRDPDIEAERLRRRFVPITRRFLRSRRRRLSWTTMAVLMGLAFAIGALTRTFIDDGWSDDLHRLLASGAALLRPLWS